MKYQITIVLDHKGLNVLILENMFGNIGIKPNLHQFDSKFPGDLPTLDKTLVETIKNSDAILFFDLFLGKTENHEYIKRIKLENPDIKILAYSNSPTIDESYHCMCMGVCDYLYGNINSIIKSELIKSLAKSASQ